MLLPSAAVLRATLQARPLALVLPLAAVPRLIAVSSTTTTSLSPSRRPSTSSSRAVIVWLSSEAAPRLTLALLNTATAAAWLPSPSASLKAAVLAVGRSADGRAMAGSGRAAVAWTVVGRAHRRLCHQCFYMTTI